MMRANFTPVLDVLVQEHDMYTALVFGKMWRYSQMGDNVCRASQERMAQELGISVKTMKRRQDILEEAGLIRLLDSGVGTPNTWWVQDIVLQKAELALEGHKVQPHRTESPTTLDTESKKESIEESKEDNPPSATPTKQQQWVEALAYVTGYNYETRGSYLGKVASQLRKHGYTLEDLRVAFYPKTGRWYSLVWPGTDGQMPNPTQVADRIKYLTSKRAEREMEKLYEDTIAGRRK